MRADDGPRACLVAANDRAGRLHVEHVAEPDVERVTDAGERGERHRAEPPLELTDEAARQARGCRELRDRQPALAPNGAQPLADTGLGDVFRGQKNSLLPGG